MNKKGVGILALSALAFLVAIIIFYSHSDSQRPGDKTAYLGEIEVSLFNTYFEAEKEMLYIDLAAGHSVRMSCSQNCLDKKNDAEKLALIQDPFREDFSKRLDRFNELFNRSLAVEDYTFSVKGDDFIGLYGKELNFTTPSIDYRFKPNFRIKLK